ncbi:TRAP transporter substrate-binding protein [Peribacillus aracenensis]|uniref:TRAP transporter substrate-binding protein n=1 Tax=Peribacillus aracenensis TaxID=2976708 RepID=UPI0021A5635C|nr:TRAP transporter substrate-binding protein DctP [Peribacillus sp. BBB004]
MKGKWMMILLFVLLTLGLAACSNTEKTQTEVIKKSNEEVIKIKIADSFPNTHSIAKLGVIPWIERIEELGEGKIEVEYYPAEQLGKAASLLDLAKNKVADITYVMPGYFADKMPLSSIASNPGLVPGTVVGSKAYNKLVQENLYELEFKPNGVKPLWAATLNPYQIVTADRPVKSVEDFKGLRVFTSGGVQEAIMHHFNSTPVSMSASEIYTSWDRGTIDSAMLTLFSWPGYQVDKLAKYSSTNAQLTSVGFAYVVNEEVWNSWPENVQNVVSQASEETIEKLSTGIAELEESLQEEYEAEGIEFYEIQPDELKKWNEELKPINEKWAEDLEAKGLPGTEILEKFQQYIEEFQQ